MMSSITRGFRFLKRRGLRGALEVLHLVKPKNDCLMDLAFLMGENSVHPDCSSVQASGGFCVNWFVNEPPLISWECNLLFDVVSGLERSGIHNRICLFQSYGYRDNEAKFYEMLSKWYPMIDDRIELCVNHENICHADANIATSWQTAYFVNSIDDSSDKYYFIQNYEPFQYAAGSYSCFVNNSFDLGLHGISVGPILSRMIQESHNMEFDEISIACDTDIFVPGVKSDNVFRVLFYANSGMATQNYILGMLALRSLYEKHPQLEVVYFGDEMTARSSPFDRAYDLGLLRNSDLAQVYTQCDVAILLSEDNPTELPLEVMASGVVPIVLDKPRNTWLLDNESVVFAQPNPNDIAEAIYELYCDKILLEKKRAYAIRFAQEGSWEVEAGKLAQLFSKGESE